MPFRYRLCAQWRALVLIDEAEMLLEKRAAGDVVRNALVCVMLRILEFYQGTLFLTSNRVGCLDPAFQSRVTCALRYGARDAAGRRAVWRALLCCYVCAALQQCLFNKDVSPAFRGAVGVLAARPVRRGG